MMFTSGDPVLTVSVGHSCHNVLDLMPRGTAIPGSQMSKWIQSNHCSAPFVRQPKYEVKSVPKPSRGGARLGNRAPHRLANLWGAPSRNSVFAGVLSARLRANPHFSTSSHAKKSLLPRRATAPASTDLTFRQHTENLLIGKTAESRVERRFSRYTAPCAPARPNGSRLLLRNDQPR